MTRPQRAIALFHNFLDTEAALRKLKNANFALERVFVIAGDRDREQTLIDNQLGKSLRNRFEPQLDLGNAATATELTPALIHLDIPVEAARSYSQLVAKGECLVMLEANHAELLRAEKILNDNRVREWAIYEVVREHPEVIIVDRRHHNL